MKYDEYVVDVDKYIELKDSTIFDMSLTTCSELKETRDLLERIKLKSKDSLYCLVDEWAVELPEEEAKEIFNVGNLISYGDIEPEDVRIVC